MVLSVPSPARSEEPLLVDALRRQGARLVEREGDRFVARMPAPDGIRRLLADVEAAIRASTSLRDPSIAWRWPYAREWDERWAREVRPRKVGTRLVVTPAGVDAGADPGDVVLRLTPGLAFGTAEHPTTRSCLLLIERLIAGGERVLDVGAGSGILAIAAVALGARTALALERDSDACGLARTNARLNGVADRVRVRRVEVTPRRLARLRGDLVLANLEPKLLLPLLPALGRAFRRSGRLVLSGVPLVDRDHVQDVTGARGLAVEAEVIEDGWWTAVVRRSA